MNRVALSLLILSLLLLLGITCPARTEMETLDSLECPRMFTTPAFCSYGSKAEQIAFTRTKVTSTR
jgi:hypothetical protein